VTEEYHRIEYSSTAYVAGRANSWTSMKERRLLRPVLLRADAAHFHLRASRFGKVDHRARTCGTNRCRAVPQSSRRRRCQRGVSVWFAVFDEAASQGRTLIFTFAPEPTVAPDFPDRVRESIERKGSQIVFVALDLPRAEQERRLVEEGRAAFGKMRDLSLLRKLRPQLDACMAAMPQPALTLDVNDLTPSASAEVISRLISI
jgi:hypothetical protein